MKRIITADSHGKSLSSILPNKSSTEYVMVVSSSSAPLNYITKNLLELTEDDHTIFLAGETDVTDNSSRGFDFKSLEKITENTNLTIDSIPMRRIVNEWGIHFRSKPPSRQTVYDIRDRFEQHRSVMDAPRSGRPTTVSTDDNLLRVCLAVTKSPRKSTRRLASGFITKVSAKNVTQTEL
ncbi:hypothetical protein J6590_062448 [Homalodisca vitripennis]|nr:hypothetical protein J6590_062448 [Homalodisca vitripennis]